MVVLVQDNKCINLKYPSLPYLRRYGIIEHHHGHIATYFPLSAINNEIKNNQFFFSFHNLMSTRVVHQKLDLGNQVKSHRLLICHSQVPIMLGLLIAILNLF